MQVNPYIFRGYDLRGIAGKDLNEEIVRTIGRCFGTYLGRLGVQDALVGRDCRLTSPEYSNYLISGLRDTGVNVINVGLTSVGTLYWAQYDLKIKGGALVSASHNSAEYNGFKFAIGYSRTVGGEEIQDLRKMVENDDFVLAKEPGTLSEKDIKEDYISDLALRFKLDKKYKVVVDASNGMSGIFVPPLLRKLGCEVFEYNCQPDGSFPSGTPDPTERKIAERIGVNVLAKKADLGLSFDADGDRIGIVDEKGGVVWNDALLALFAIDVLEQNPGAKIVFNTLCSKLVDDVIKDNGGQPVMCRTGHYFIKDKAHKEKAKFAGELSGHFFFLDKFYPHDDGSYAALRLLDYLSRTGQSLSQAISRLPKYISSPEIKVGCPDHLKVALMPKIAQRFKIDFPNSLVIDDERAGDGVRLEGSTEMLIIRYSQNGPYLTIKFEAKTQERYNELREYINKILHQYDEVDWKFGVNVESLQ